MRFFRRKKSDDEEDEQISQHKQRKSSPSPRLRRIKKEPEKPWGKKERLLVLIVLIFTLASSAILALSAREWKLPGVPRIKVQIPSFSLFREEKITIEGDRDKVRDVVKSNEVITKFEGLTNALSGVYGLYIYNLDVGFSYGVDEEEIFQAASLIKLPVMVAMYLQNEAGELDLDEKYVLRNSDKVSGAGSLYTKPEGYEITYRDLIRLMAKQSDNTAYSITRKLLGDQMIDETIVKIGMTQTSLETNETTPKDIGIFFEGLWKGKIINSEHKEELFDFLTDTIYEEWLAAGVLEDVRVAHKYGRETHVVNDAGIVYTDHPYVIVIMSKGVVEGEADEIFPELARTVFEVETQ